MKISMLVLLYKDSVNFYLIFQKLQYSGSKCFHVYPIAYMHMLWHVIFELNLLLLWHQHCSSRKTWKLSELIQYTLNNIGPNALCVQLINWLIINMFEFFIMSIKFHPWTPDLVHSLLLVLEMIPVEHPAKGIIL